MNHQIDFVLDDCPSWSDLRTLWDAMMSDDSVPGNFTDPFPMTLTAFVEPIEAGVDASMADTGQRRAARRPLVS